MAAVRQRRAAVRPPGRAADRTAPGVAAHRAGTADGPGPGPAGARWGSPLPGGQVESRARSSFILPSGQEYSDFTSDPASGGMTITPQVYNQFLTSLRKKSAFLPAGVNVAPIDSGSLHLPTASDDGTASIVDEGATIPTSDIQVADNGFKAYKVAMLRAVTHEVLADSAIDIRKGVTDAMIRGTASAVDDYFLNGAGVKQPLGLLKTPGVVSTALTAAITLDNVADEMAAFEAFGGTVAAILADPASFNVLRKAKASTAGTYHSSPFAATDGPRQIWGANPIPAPRMASGMVALMDSSQVWAGLRQDVEIMYSEEYFFAQDKLRIRLTSRWAGVGLTDTKAARVLTKAANGT
ncbi:phage major capsid protein [Kitasatospora sp. NPDC088134]|uniref:phage major capsid protein n=1 Tax=Kitasatospora sp. NPDC088134 TaxID=3364071 RepID=UPI003806207A